jgi:predicted polyphosphate/ATP-dependent NAD kinase
MTRLPHHPAVGIVANPASGRDIRRLVAHASVFPLAEKCNIISRLLVGLRAAGVKQVLLMPDVAGIAERMRRALNSPRPAGQPWPEVLFLEMPVENGPEDTVRAVQGMVAAGVGAVAVLGGDGTHRLAAMTCGETPLLALSTGTNNVFPSLREATVAGLAAGLVATCQVPPAETSVRNKALRVTLNGRPCGLALVDVSVSRHLWVGSKALWDCGMVHQIFVTFAEVEAVGLSSIAALLRPVSRHDPYGVRVDLAPADSATTRLMAPIAPGLVQPVGILSVQDLLPGEPYAVRLSQGVVALDGEREIEFGSNDEVLVRLVLDGPFTIDVEGVMRWAARQGLFRMEGVFDAARHN